MLIVFTTYSAASCHQINALDKNSSQKIPPRPSFEHVQITQARVVITMIPVWKEIYVGRYTYPCIPDLMIPQSPWLAFYGRFPGNPRRRHHCSYHYLATKTNFHRTSAFIQLRGWSGDHVMCVTCQPRTDGICVRGALGMVSLDTRRFVITSSQFWKLPVPGSKQHEVASQEQKKFEGALVGPTPACGAGANHCMPRAQCCPLIVGISIRCLVGSPYTCVIGIALCGFGFCQFSPSPALASQLDYQTKSKGSCGCG